MIDKQLKFSQRMGKTAPSRSVQLNNMDDELRNRLWNIIKTIILDEALAPNSIKTRFMKSLDHNFFKIPLNEDSYYLYEAEKSICARFFEMEWFAVYDLIEFIAKFCFKGTVTHDFFVGETNLVLAEEFSAYRLIDGVVCPITNDVEVKEVEQAIDQDKKFADIKGVNIHFSTALKLLSDKKSPDYRNSIKESISAVETLCRKLTGQSTLGESLKTLEKSGVSMNEQLKDGFIKFYAYTNSKDSGTRHAIMDGDKIPDFDDAKYMLVICSAFINFLIGKCSTNGIKIFK